MKGNAVLQNKRPRLENDVTTNANQSVSELENGARAEISDVEMRDAEVESAAFNEVANVLIAFLVKCKLPRDTSKVKKKFEETVELRKKMMLDIGTYKQLFDLYLVLPDLVRSYFHE